MKMYKLLLILSIFSWTNGQIDLEPCDKTICKLPECHCASTELPVTIPENDIPKFVMLAIEGEMSFDTRKYYDTILNNRQNPDRCGIKITTFANMTEVIFSVASSIYDRGATPALSPLLTDFSISQQALQLEYLTQKSLMENLIDVHFTTIGQGYKSQYYMSDIFYKMIADNGISYDMSKNIKLCSSPGQWPYSLHYNSFFSCPNWPLRSSHPKVWVIPNNLWYGDVDEKPCEMLNECNVVAGTEFNWLSAEFTKFPTKLPVTIRLHHDWFKRHVSTLNNFEKFLNYIQLTYGVFMVTPSQVIQWMKNPKTISQMVQNPECT